jgi:hypothetical protein
MRIGARRRPQRKRNERARRHENPDTTRPGAARSRDRPAADEVDPPSGGGSLPRAPTVVKNWIATFAAVLAAGLVLLGWQAWRPSREGAETDGRAQWERNAARWRERAGDALEQKVSPSTATVLRDLLGDAQRLRQEKPARANDSEFRSAVVRVEAFADRVKGVDWEEVFKWERDVQAVAENLRRAMADQRNWEEERAAAIRAAETRMQELRAVRPWCADDEPEEDVRRAFSLARTTSPAGRR